MLLSPTHVQEDAMTPDNDPTMNEAEQIQLAREIGASLTDAFVGYVRGQVPFDDLSFGVYDALHDLYVVRSGDYELVDDDHDHHQHDDVLDEQEDLAQEPHRDASG